MLIVFFQSKFARKENTTSLLLIYLLRAFLCPSITEVLNLCTGTMETILKKVGLKSLAKMSNQ